MCRNGYVFQTVVTMHVQRNTFCSGSFLTRAVVTKQSHNKLCNWHADSSRRSIVQLSRERTAPRISSWTSLKQHIHFSFILKLIIFIYKQLKRPVAFSVVHFDVKPQIVMLQNNFFYFEFIQPWKFLFPKTLVTPTRNLFSHWFQNQLRALRKKILPLSTCTVIRVITLQRKSNSPSRDWMEIMKRLARFSSGVAMLTEPWRDSTSTTMACRATTCVSSSCVDPHWAAP